MSNSLEEKIQNPPLEKGGWGDFVFGRRIKSPSIPLFQRGK